MSLKIGTLIEITRRERKVNRKRLAKGLFSEQTLYMIENNQCDSDLLTLYILLQRLGKSPDKLEIVMSLESYQIIELRDAIEDAILKGYRGRAEKLLEKYPQKTAVDKMYKHRMRSWICYYIDKDYESAIMHVESAIASTLFDFSYDKIENYMISAIEMENLLALERMLLEWQPEKATREGKRRLEICMKYIDVHFTDGEEHAKIYSKCAWLLGQILEQEEKYYEAMKVCEQGMEELSKYTILYFMLPLLELMSKIEKRIESVQNKWSIYYVTLHSLWVEAAEEWYPLDALFHNCYQKEYHIDSEFIRAERVAKGYTQEQLIEGIYQSPESLSRIENGKASPNQKNFNKLMEKLGVEKQRYNTFVTTDSFKALEMRQEIDIMIMKNDYKRANIVLEALKEELLLDVQENRCFIEDIEIYINRQQGTISSDEAMRRSIMLLEKIYDFENKKFHHIPMRNEVALINRVSIYMCAERKEDMALELLQKALDMMETSKIDIKYRYRSYALLMNSRERIRRKGRVDYKALKYEFLCGKASMLPFCINNIVHNIIMSGVPEKECLKWCLTIYYICDLFSFENEKDIYKKYLMEEYKLDV